MQGNKSQNASQRKLLNPTATVSLFAALFVASPVFAGISNRLTLETNAACQGDSNGAGPGDLVAVELWMRDLGQNATGFQAFLTFDDALLSYRGDLSSYSLTPFPQHVQAIGAAEVSVGNLNLDGSDDFGGSGTNTDALLATLIFEVLPGADCQSTQIQFRLNPPFTSELSFEGTPLVTDLSDSPTFTLDNTPPDITFGVLAACYPDQSTAESAALAATSATDTCTAPGLITYAAQTTGDPCNATVTVSATDACGNTSTTDYAVRLDNLAPVLADCPTDFAIMAAPGDCEAVVNYTDPTATDDCDGPVAVTCIPPSGDVFPAGDTVVTCTSADACGNTSTCTFTVTVNAVRNRLTLEAVDPVQCYLEGETICINIWMRCLDQPVTGFNAFVKFNADVLLLQPGLSSYTNSPFPLHISDPISANIVGPIGVVALDGSINPMDPAVTDDALLATLCFTVKAGMGGEIIEFDFADPPTPTIGNELSFQGDPVPTDLATTILITPQPRLRLVPITPAKCYEPHDLVCVELRMECLGDQLVTGFNAFVGFDQTVLRFEPSLSAYTNSPFPLHINPISAGSLDLDGSVNPIDPPTDDDAVLATLCFRVLKFRPEEETLIFFRAPPTPSIGNELSVFGTPVPTLLEDAFIATFNLLKLRLCYQDDGLICVLLEMACLHQETTGFTAYLEYNNDVLEFQPGPSGYTPSPFTDHINLVSPNIIGPSGQFDLDGSVAMMDPGTTDSATLAAMCFKVRPGMESVPTMVTLRPPPPMEVSALIDINGPVSTHLRDSAFFNNAGDIDMDGDVDLIDLELFAGVLVSADTDAGRRARCDLNCDDVLNGFDINPFLDLILP